MSTWGLKHVSIQGAGVEDNSGCCDGSSTETVITEAKDLLKRPVISVPDVFLKPIVTLLNAWARQHWLTW